MKAVRVYLQGRDLGDKFENSMVRMATDMGLRIRVEERSENEIKFVVDGDDEKIVQHLQWCVHQQDMATVKKWNVEWSVEGEVS